MPDDVLPAQPCAIFPIPSVDLAFHPRISTIEIFVVPTLVYGSSRVHGMTDVDFIRKDDETSDRDQSGRAGIGVMQGPGKDAIAINQQQAVDINRHQSQSIIHHHNTDPESKSRPQYHLS